MLLESLVHGMLKKGASVEEIIQCAVGLSREAYKKFVNLEKLIDDSFGSDRFRRETVDPLFNKERELDAIRSRVRRGGHVRVSDRDNNLQSLLHRRERELDSLEADFPWSGLELSNRQLVKDYMSERRNHLLLGDVERVRSTYIEAVSQTALAC